MSEGFLDFPHPPPFYGGKEKVKRKLFSLSGKSIAGSKEERKKFAPQEAKLKGLLLLFSNNTFNPMQASEVNKATLGMWYLLSKVDVSGQRHCRIVILFVIAHPNFGGSSGISRENVARSAGKSVGMLLTEYVTDSTARDDFQGPPALPHAERDLQVLAAPNVHVHVVFADAVEVRLVDHKEAAGDHGRLDGRRRVRQPGFTLFRAQVLPLED